jgi:hypothetical protein
LGVGDEVRDECEATYELVPSLSSEGEVMAVNGRVSVSVDGGSMLVNGSSPEVEVSESADERSSVEEDGSGNEKVNSKS